MKYVLFTLLLLPLLVSCSTNIVPVKVTEQGISVEVENLKVNNMSAGRSINVIYRIYNNSRDDIKPDIFPELNVDTSKYSEAVEYGSAPPGLSDWLDIHDGISIAPGEFKDCIVNLNIPVDTVIANDKWAFRVGVAGGCGGFAQTSISVWWLIDMR